MKRLFLFLILAASVSGAQTLDDARLAHNATSCEALGLATTCTDAEAAAAWSAANGAVARPVERQVLDGAEWDYLTGRNGGSYRNHGDHGSNYSRCFRRGNRRNSYVHCICHD